MQVLQEKVEGTRVEKSEVKEVFRAEVGGVSWSKIEMSG